MHYDPLEVNALGHNLLAISKDSEFCTIYYIYSYSAGFIFTTEGCDFRVTFTVGTTTCSYSHFSRIP